MFWRNENVDCLGPFPWVGSSECLHKNLLGKTQSGLLPLPFQPQHCLPKSQLPCDSFSKSPTLISFLRVPEPAPNLSPNQLQLPPIFPHSRNSPTWSNMDTADLGKSGGDLMTLNKMVRLEFHKEGTT